MHNIWLGLTRTCKANANRCFQWDDHSELILYNNWSDKQWDEPNNIGGYQNCVYMQWPDKMWLDGNCDDMRNVICEMVGTNPVVVLPPVVPPPTPVVVLPPVVAPPTPVVVVPPVIVPPTPVVIPATPPIPAPPPIVAVKPRPTWATVKAKIVPPKSKFAPVDKI